MKFPDKEPLFIYTHKLRTRYNETDQMGYVYHARYLEYFEAARTEFVRSLGYTYKEMEDNGVMLPVIKAELQFNTSIFYDDELLVDIMFYEIPMVRLRTFYRVRTERGGDEPHVLGYVELVFLDAEKRKPTKAPAKFIERLKEKISG